MILHFFLNSLFVFFVLTLMIELSLFVFRVENARIRCICRYFPMIKLPLDFLIYGILGYVDTFFINLNPFSCKIYVQKLILSIMPHHIRSEFGTLETVVIPEYIGMQIPSTWLQGCLITFLVISGLLILRKTLQVYRSRKTINNMFTASSNCDRVISNQLLQQDLAKSHTVILSSSELEIPSAAYQHYIIIPKTLSDELSQDEFEAVVAHEYAHLRWKDPLFKMIFSAICSLFWWIPTQWWLKKLEVDQEKACDSRLGRYKIDTTFLASAILKVIHRTKSMKLNYDLMPACLLHSSKSEHVERLESLLQIDHRVENSFHPTQVLSFIFCVLICICFWMC